MRIPDWQKNLYNEVMKRRLLGFLLLLSLSLTYIKVKLVQAGGGPVEVRLSAVQGYVNQVVKFDVYFHPTKPDEIPAQTMNLYLVDPKDGRSCKLYSDRTDNTGKVSGECTSSVSGDLKFYIHWMEGGRSSDDTTITFVSAPLVVKTSPSPVAKKIIHSPTPSPLAIPSPSCQPTPCPSPGCSITASPQPLPTPSPIISPSPPVITKVSQNGSTNQWFFITIASFTIGLGLPIIFFMLTKKS